MPPARKSIPIRKPIFAAVAPLRVSFRKVSFILKAKYRAAAEKKIITRIKAMTMPIIARSNGTDKSPLRLLPLHDYANYFFSQAHHAYAVEEHVVEQ